MDGDEINYKIMFEDLFPRIDPVEIMKQSNQNIIQHQKDLMTESSSRKRGIFMKSSATNLRQHVLTPDRKSNIGNIGSPLGNLNPRSITPKSVRSNGASSAYHEYVTNQAATPVNSK